MPTNTVVCRWPSTCTCTHSYCLLGICFELSNTQRMADWIGITVAVEFAATTGCQLPWYCMLITVASFFVKQVIKRLRPGPRLYLKPSWFSYAAADCALLIQNCHNPRKSVISVISVIGIVFIDIFHVSYTDVWHNDGYDALLEVARRQPLWPSRCYRSYLSMAALSWLTW